MDNKEESENTLEIPKRQSKGRRWLRRLVKTTVVLLILLVVFLLWLNGPGIRWLGPKIAGRYFRQGGIEGSFSLDGSVTSGLSVRDLKLGGGIIPGEISVSKIAPVYQFRRALNGEVDGIVVDGLYARIDLDQTTPSKKKPGTRFDAARLAESLRKVRAQLLPLRIRLADIRVTVVRGSQPVAAIASSDFTHEPGSDDFRIRLGELTDAQGRRWPAQDSLLKWQPEALSLDKLEPLPGLGVRGLAVSFPKDGEASAEANVLVDDAALHVALGPGFRDARMDLREGSLRIEDILKRTGATVPLTATISSLAVDLRNVLPDPKKTTGEVRLLVQDFDASGWRVPEASLDATIANERVGLVAKGRMFDSDVAVDAAAPLRRGTQFELGNITGKLSITDVPTALKALSRQVKGINPNANVPASSLTGTFGIAMEKNRLGKIDADLTITPVDPRQASPLHLITGWQAGQPLDAVLRTEEMIVKYGMNAGYTTYQGAIEWSGFQMERVKPWLEVAHVRLPGKLGLDGTFNAEGNFKAGTHKGSLVLANGSFVANDPAAREIKAIGSLDFQWPGEVKVSGLRVSAGDQHIAMDALMKDGFLDVPRLEFYENETRLLGGTVKLPVPPDFSKWRETIATEARPIDVHIQSEVTALERLRNWVPQFAEFESAATGRVMIDIIGTYADPAIDAVVELRDLRRRGQAKLPAVDATLKLKGAEDVLEMNGELLAHGYAPAVLRARSDFKPAEWAGNPEKIKAAEISGRLDLPRIELARFTALVPALRRMDGLLNGNVVIAGTIGKPIANGALKLTGGSIVLREGNLYPAIENIGADVAFSMDRVTLQQFRATAAGGVLKASGGMPISGGRPGDVDLRITGDHLLIKRDDKIILRANANLRLSGPVESAVVSGSVDLVDSLFYRDIEIIPVGVPFVGPSAASLPKLDPALRTKPRVPAPLGNWRLAVRVRTGMPFLIRGNLGTGNITADVQAGGTLADPQLRGEANIHDAVLALPYTKLRVRRGIVRFTPESGLDPILEIRGTAEPRPYRVFLYAYGRASDPQLLLTSSPPLPRHEIMTLLATGTTTAGLENSSQASSRALQLLAEEVRRGRVGVARPLRPLLKLVDRVDFTLADEDPYTSAKFSSATISLTDRWLLSASMGEEGETRVMGIWRLTFR
ncbi:MAG: translocation/assembly module TamB domain-containing protein [Verrucomicrobiota bacterium]